MLKVHQRAPSFELPDTSGRTISLSTLRQQGPLLLAFFKVSCPTCQFTFPFLERLRNSNVFGISQDPLPATEKFRASFGITFPLLLDSAKQGYPISNAYAITNVPTLYLVETDGTISMAAIGFSRSDLEHIGQRFGTAVFTAGEQTPAFKAG